MRSNTSVLAMLIRTLARAVWPSPTVVRMSRTDGWPETAADDTVRTLNLFESTVATEHLLKSERT